MLVKPRRGKNYCHNLLARRGRQLEGGGTGIGLEVDACIDINECVVSAEHFSIPNLCQERPYCFWIGLRVEDLLVCLCLYTWLCHMPAGTLLGWWCVCHTYWEEGHGVTGPRGRWECSVERGNRPNLRKAGSFLFWGEGTQRTLSSLWIPS